LVLENCGQKDVCTEIFKGVDERFKVSNHRIEDLEQKVDNLSSINATLVELKLLSQQNVASNKDRDEMLKSHSEALVQVSNTLININKQFEETNKELEKQNIKIDKTDEKIKELNKDNSIKIFDVIKNIIYVAIGCGATIFVTKLIGS
jgi:septal ring factor EnvC (AmiA/AmiB activator)